MPRPRAIVTVDERLLWLIALSETPVGASRPASPASLDLLGGHFDATGRAAAADLTACITGAVAEALIEWLRDLPELPFIGEPFGGVEGTD